jgi:hypothetical protein
LLLLLRLSTTIRPPSIVGFTPRTPAEVVDQPASSTITSEAV